MQSWQRIALSLVFGLSVTATGAQAPDGARQQLPEDRPISPDFRGEMVWRGFYQGKALVPDGGTNVRGRGFSFNLPGSRQVPLGGDYVIRMEIDHGMLRGEVKTTGALDPGTFSGTIDGTTCHIVSSDGGRSDAYCSRRFFREHVDQVNAQRQRVIYDSQTQIARIANRDIEDRDRAVAQAKAVADAAAAKVAADAAAAAEAARIAAMKPAMPGAAKALETAVRSDSNWWQGARGNPLGNKYVEGTVQDVRIVSGNSRNGLIRASYLYNGSESGWVEAKVENGEVICLHYWDANECSPVRLGSPPPLKSGPGHFYVPSVPHYCTRRNPTLGTFVSVPC